MTEGTRTPSEAVAATPDEAAPPALELRSVSAGYGASAVLHDISLSVPRSSVVALLGPNGAGKTTTLRVASGLLRPNRGTVVIGGKEAGRAAPFRRSRLGVCLIPEGRGIFRSLTVRENLELLIPPWRKDKSIDPAVQAFPILGERIGQVAGSMSGGQQQQLALARAFLSDPDVVLLDEVSMGLAPVIVDQIFASLKLLAATGVALVLVEQYVSRALEMADTAYLMARGTIAWSGPAAALDTDAITRAYLGHADEVPVAASAQKEGELPMTLDLDAANYTLSGLRPFPVAVTTVYEGRANGLMSLSAGAAAIVPEAPRVTISLTKYNLTHDMVLKSGVFVMHLLAATPEPAMEASLRILMGLGGSSGRDGDKISQFDTKPGVTGSPILLDALSYVEGRVVASLDVQEATIFVADVVGAERLRDGERLRVGPAWARLPKEWIEQYEANHVPQLESARRYRGLVD